MHTHSDYDHDSDSDSDGEISILTPSFDFPAEIIFFSSASRSS